MDEKRIEIGVLDIGENGKKYVMDVLNTNRLSYGPYLKKFETEFSKIHDCKFGITSNSGTSSLHTALACLKEMHSWNDGDEVIVPAVTFVATSNIILHNNLKPVFVDVERDFYGIDVSRIEEKITNRTRAIIPVHLFGMPCAMDEIKKIADKYGLKIIEDSCETMFARYKDNMVGSWSDISCFSMYIAHLIVTGVGGISLTSNPEYAVALRSLSNHGRDSIYVSIDDDNNKTTSELKEIIRKRFSFVRLGHSFRITEMEGALGVAHLETWQDMIEKRRLNAAFLTEALSPLKDKIQLPSIRPGAEHSFMMYPIVVLDSHKWDLVNFLESKGIETREMLPLINQPIYKKFGVNEDDFPNAKWINTSGFYIGCHQGLKLKDLQYVVTTFFEFFKK